jgi:hypothetical protein
VSGVTVPIVLSMSPATQVSKVRGHRYSRARRAVAVSEPSHLPDETTLVLLMCSQTGALTNEEPVAVPFLPISSTSFSDQRHPHQEDNIKSLHTSRRLAALILVTLRSAKLLDS